MSRPAKLEEDEHQPLEDGNPRFMEGKRYLEMLQHGMTTYLCLGGVFKLPLMWLRTDCLQEIEIRFKNRCLLLNCIMLIDYTKL